MGRLQLSKGPADLHLIQYVRPCQRPRRRLQDERVDFGVACRQIRGHTLQSDQVRHLELLRRVENLRVTHQLHPYQHSNPVDSPLQAATDAPDLAGLRHDQPEPMDRDKEGKSLLAFQDAPAPPGRERPQLDQRNV